MCCCMLTPELSEAMYTNSLFRYNACWKAQEDPRTTAAARALGGEVHELVVQVLAGRRASRGATSDTRAPGAEPWDLEVQSSETW